MCNFKVLRHLLPVMSIFASAVVSLVRKFTIIICAAVRSMLHERRDLIHVAALQTITLQVLKSLWIWTC